MSAPPGVPLKRRPTGPAGSTDWMDNIPCRDSRVDFTSDDEFDMRDAKRICHTQCGVRTECLHYAIYRRQHQGVWGGMTPDERRELKAGVTS